VDAPHGIIVMGTGLVLFECLAAISIIPKCPPCVFTPARPFFIMIELDSTRYFNDGLCVGVVNISCRDSKLLQLRPWPFSCRHPGPWLAIPKSILRLCSNTSISLILIVELASDELRRGVLAQGLNILIVARIVLLP